MSGPELARRAEADPLLTPKQAGAVFGVDTRTVTRWAKAGLIEAVFTAGGRRRYRTSDVQRLFEQAQRQGGQR